MTRNIILLFVFASVFSLSMVAFGPLTPQTVYAQDDEVAADADAKIAEAKADGGDAVASDTAPVADSYLFWYLKALGPIFAPAFAITSVIFVMLIVMNYMTINRNNLMPQAMLDQFRAQLDEKQYQEAYETAKASDSPQGKILAAGLAKMSSGYEAAQQSMSDVAEEEIMGVEQKLGFIAMISGIAPMLGLLGTVVGMIDSFNVIARSGTAPQASELAGGISTALITTEVGLFIAIPAIIIYEMYRNKLAKLVLEMTVQTESLMGRFKPA